VSKPSVTVLGSADAVAREAAERVIHAAARHRGAAGRFRLGLSGGQTPRLLYQLLAGEYSNRIEPARLELLFADERAVSSDSPDSNYRLVRETLLEGLAIPANQVHRMPADAVDLEAAAREYESQLRPPLDLLLLGIGEDGHTASLFPGSALLAERARRVAVVLDSPKPPPRRLTILPRVIEEARLVVMLATGADKAAAIARALAPTGSVSDCPARLARGGQWLLDRAAAGK